MIYSAGWYSVIGFKPTTRINQIWSDMSHLYTLIYRLAACICHDVLSFFAFNPHLSGKRPILLSELPTFVNFLGWVAPAWGDGRKLVNPWIPIKIIKIPMKCAHSYVHCTICLWKEIAFDPSSDIFLFGGKSQFWMSVPDFCVYNMIIGWIKTQNIGSIHIFMKNHPVIYGKLCPKCVPTFPMWSIEKLWEHRINGISRHCGWLRSPALGWLKPDSGILTTYQLVDFATIHPMSHAAPRTRMQGVQDRLPAVQRDLSLPRPWGVVRVSRGWAGEIFARSCSIYIMDRTSRFLRFPKIGNGSLFPQQRMLMGSSAQSSSGVHWCRCRVKFNEVPEKVPRFRRRSGRGWCRGRWGSAGFWRRFRRRKVWEALVQSQVRFSRFWRRFRRSFRRRSGRLWCKSQVGFNIRRREALVQSRVRFNRVPEKVPREGVAGFGAEPGQVQQGRVREKVPEKPGRLWCRASSGEGSGGFGAEARSGSTGFRRRFRRRFQQALVQRQVRFNGFRRRFRRRLQRRFRRRLQRKNM